MSALWSEHTWDFLDPHMLAQASAHPGLFLPPACLTLLAEQLLGEGTLWDKVF